MANNETRASVMGTHFVVHITVTQVDDVKHEPVYRGQGTETREHKTNELGKIILKDKVIGNLIEKAKKSLDIMVE